jgi:heme-degrading monooxygenase HmoA
MYSRVTPFELDTVRRPLDEAVAYFTENVLPDLRQQQGYEGVYVLVNPDGKGLVVSMWARQEDAEDGLRNGFYAAQVDKFVALFRAPPGREGYDVVLTDAPVFVPD